MRLKSALWVAAYLRRVSAEGLFGAVVKRGAEEAGAIFVKVNRLDGTADLYGPAPQAVFDDDHPIDRRWRRLFRELATAESEVDARLARERRFDEDLWIVEIESRSGEHCLESVVD